MSGDGDRTVMMRCVMTLGLAVTMLLGGCAATYPARAPVGEVFPAVEGRSLAGQAVALPGDWAGAPVVVMVGYKQQTQFDIDRWMLGLRESGVEVRVVEVPTIAGLGPRVFRGAIDRGMRSGIPKDDWASVVTVYDDAEAIMRFTGNAEALPARVLLLDSAGRVVFFHDAGYSVDALMRLREALGALSGLP